MKTGRSLAEVILEVERQAAQKRDLLADTRELAMLNGKELNIGGPASQQFGQFPLTQRAQRQLSGYLDIPASFYDRVLGERPQLLDRIVNELMEDRPGKRLIRILDDRVRAFLSDRYRMLDNIDLIQAILPILAEVEGLEIHSSEVTESHLYLKAVFPRIQGEVKPGDVVQAGLVFRNSETGDGTLSIQELWYRLMCRNGAIGQDVLRQYHAGRAIKIDETTEVTFKDETKAAIDHAFWLTVKDMTAHAVSEARFHEALRKMQIAAGSPVLQAPSAGVQEIGKRYQLGEAQQSSILRHLIEGGDLSQWGALNAVTRASQEQEDYEEATRMEAVGGEILELDPKVWGELARAA